MNQQKTGRLIRSLRRKQQLTQLALATKLGVSDKAVSKWERGVGAPDISLLPLLSQTLGVDMEALLRGELEENDMAHGDMKKIKVYYCLECKNVLFALDDASISCCGKKLLPLPMQPADESHRLHVTNSDGEWYITSEHPMVREHYLSFVAFVKQDTFLVKKQYPEWGLEVRLPALSHGILLWHCTRDGLFWEKL